MRILYHALLCLMILLIAFAVASAAMLFLLWEFTYGDTYGGRWQKLAWPFGGVGAIVAVSLYCMRVIGGIRLGWAHYAASLAVLAVVASAFVLVATTFLWPLPIPM
jgi:hypothetical protein